MQNSCLYSVPRWLLHRPCKRAQAVAARGRELARHVAEGKWRYFFPKNLQDTNTVRSLLTPFSEQLDSNPIDQLLFFSGVFLEHL